MSRTRGLLALALGLWLGASLAVAGHAFTIYSPIALVADDPQVTARLHDSLRLRYRNLVVRDSLAAAKSEAGGDGGLEVAIVVSSSRDRGTVTAYGSTLEVCQVMVTAQVLRLPAARLEFSRSAAGRGPDCVVALEKADAGLADALVKGLEEYRRRGVEVDKEYLWVQLANDWPAADLAELRAELLEITGIRRVVPDSDEHLIQLETYREPRALAREMDRIESVRVSRFAGRRVTLRRVGVGAPAGASTSARPEASSRPPAVSSRPPSPPPSTRPRPVPSRPPAARQVRRPAGPGAGPATPDGGKSWALVVGISKFRDGSVPELTYPAKDAQAFARVLSHPAVGRFSPDNVVVLLDKQATTRRLKMELDYLARMTRPEDKFVFFLSSHAVPGSVDVAGDAYIVTHDTEKASLYATGFPMRELVDALQARIQAETVVGFLDACYTGQIVDRAGGGFVGAKALSYEPAAGAPPASGTGAGASVGEVTGGVAAAGASPLSWTEQWETISAKTVTSPKAAMPAGESVGREGKRIVFISSSDGNQPSWESEELGHGFFTYYLMEALKQTQGQATVGWLFDFVKGEVKRAAFAELGRVQEPVMLYSADVNFSIAGRP